MTDARFSGLLRQFFQVGINIRTAKHGSGWDERGRVGGGKGGGEGGG